MQTLTEGVQDFENWQIVKYSQPSPKKRIPIGDITLKPKNIYLTWNELKAGKYYINFFVKGYDEQNKHYEGAAILHMDHTIGEYNAMTRIEGDHKKSWGCGNPEKV